VNELNLTTIDERRRFFRIDDAINLYYKIVDEQAVIAASKMSDDVLSNCSLVTALEMLDQESRLIMHRIEKNEPEIAEYLKTLDSKVSLLAQVVMRQGKDFSDGNMCNTNISASGLAIEIDHSIKVGEYLEIKLLLSSCIAVILVYGKVVYCKKNTEEGAPMPYQVGIDYVNLNDQDREILIKHIVKRQMQQIREKNNS
jgi:hypothetical protein